MILLILIALAVVVALVIMWSMPGAGSGWAGAPGRGGSGSGPRADGADCYGLTEAQRAAGFTAELRRTATGVIERPIVVLIKNPGSDRVNAVQTPRLGCIEVDGRLERQSVPDGATEASHREQGRSPFDAAVQMAAIQAVRDVAVNNPGCAPAALQWLDTWERHRAKKGGGFLGISGAYRRTILGRLARELGSCVSGVDLRRYGFKDVQELVVTLASTAAAPAEGVETT